MKKISKLLFLLITTTLLSCSEEIDKIKSTDTTTVVASSSIDAANASDVQTGIQINTIESSTAKINTPTACATIAVDNTDSYPKVFTVDYGTGCTVGLITRKGKLKITVSAPIYVTGSKMTIERIDYYINGNKFEGTIDYVNTTTIATVPQWTRTVKNGKFTNTDGKVFLNSGAYTMKQTEGISTPFILTDNVYEMTEGKHIVTNEIGNTLTLTVVETLVKKYSCEYVSKGKLKIVGGILNGVIDYGENTCDTNYTYTHENGLVYELKM